MGHYFVEFIKTKVQTISGYSHILSELISGIFVSAFLETIYFNNHAIYSLILSQGCKLNFSKPTWVLKIGLFVCSLYPRGKGGGGGALCQHQNRK